MMHWLMKGRPTDNLDTRQFKIVRIMKTHIKYCPVDNPEECHIIKVKDFKRKFVQAI